MATYKFKARLCSSGRRRVKDGGIDYVQSIFNFRLEQMESNDQILDLISQTHICDKELAGQIIDPPMGVHLIDKFHTAATVRIKKVEFANEEIPGFQFIDSLTFSKKEKREGGYIYNYTFTAYCDPVEKTAVFEKGFLNYKEDEENPKNPAKPKQVFKWFDFVIEI